MADILKAGAVIIIDRKLLVSRNKGKDVYVPPGGKLKEGENYLDALKRELLEEQGITFDPQYACLLGEFEAEAAGDKQRRIVRMAVYRIDNIIGDLHPANEIAENALVDSSTDIPLGSIVEHEVIPMLVQLDLID